MSEKQKKLIYCFSREPGGAEALALVLKVRDRNTYLLVGKDYACDIFESHGLVCKRYCGNTREELYSFVDSLQKENPASIVLTSAASIPEHDMTEKYFWNWAASRKVPSIAVLDQWQNYRERFSGPNGTNICQYLPDVICAMDESARQGMIDDKLPRERIEVVGHPSLSRLRKIMANSAADESEGVRKKLGLHSGQQLVLFVSEPFTYFYGDKAGFTELTILDELITYFEERSLSLKKEYDDIKLIIKLHPKNSLEAFSKFREDHAKMWTTRKPVILADEIDKISLLTASDLVVGMASIMLMEAIALGRPTVSLQVGARISNLCEAVNQKIIPFVSTRNEMRLVLDKLIGDPSYKDKYTNGIRNYPIIDNADSRIWEKIESLRLR